MYVDLFFFTSIPLVHKQVCACGLETPTRHALALTCENQKAQLQSLNKVHMYNVKRIFIAHQRQEE